MIWAQYLTDLVQFVPQSFVSSKREKKRKRERKNGWRLSQRQAGGCAEPSSHQDFPCCYMQLIAVLKVSH
jgi:hypothetical protein